MNAGKSIPLFVELVCSVLLLLCLSEKADSRSEAAKKAEIKELMKDVPEKEIEDFLNDAVALESNSDTDGSMNE